MDVLTDVLESVHIRGLVSGRLELTAPWGLRSAGYPGAMGFFVVTRGSFWLEVAGRDPLQLAGGDFVLLRKSDPHVMRDDPQTTPKLASEVLSKCPHQQGCQPGGVFQYGGGGALTTLVGGKFDIEDAADNPLLKALPPVIHIRGDRGTPARWLETTLQFVASEMSAGLPGAETVVNRLADVLFVQAVRAHLADTGARSGWLRALVDPQIGRALSAIHERPQAPWTVETLAAEVGMSRSAFAARFADLVEEPPLTYLTRWRMLVATKLLRTGAVSLSDVASRVGYDADAAFSKAFKRWTGSSPGAFRRSRGAASQTYGAAGFSRPSMAG